MKALLFYSLFFASLIVQAKDDMWISLVINRSLDGTVWFVLEPKNEQCLLTIKTKDTRKDAEETLFREMLVTEKECRGIFALHDKIDYEKINSLSRRMSADGSMWHVLTHNNFKEKREAWVYNPGIEYQAPEGRKLYDLGEHLWRLGELGTLLY